jgi:hypothetical protein
MIISTEAGYGVIIPCDSGNEIGFLAKDGSRE